MLTCTHICISAGHYKFLLTIQLFCIIYCKLWIFFQLVFYNLWSNTYYFCNSTDIVLDNFSSLGNWKKVDLYVFLLGIISLFAPLSIYLILLIISTLVFHYYVMRSYKYQCYISLSSNSLLWLWVINHQTLLHFLHISVDNPAFEIMYSWLIENCPAARFFFKNVQFLYYCSDRLVPGTIRKRIVQSFSLYHLKKYIVEFPWP